MIRGEVLVEHHAVLESHFLGERVAEPHRDAPLELLHRAGGIHHHSHVLRAHHALHLHRPGRGIHFHLRDGRDIRTGIVAERHAEPAFAWRDRRLPAELVGRGLQHAPHSRVLREVELTEADGIHSRLLREHVDVHLAGERVGVGTGRAPRPDPEGMHAVLIRVPAAAHHGPVVRDIVELLRAALAGADHLIAPRNDLLGRVQPRANGDHRRRVERVEEELLGAIPYHSHRFAGRDGEPRRLDRLLRRALPTESAADVGRDDPHLLGRELQRARHLRLQRERSLRARPDGDSSVGTHRRDGRVRLHRRVRDVSLEVLLLDHLHRRLLSVRDVPGFRHRAPLGGALLEMREDRPFVERRGRRTECRLDQPERLVRFVAMFVQHGYDLAVPNHAHARHRFGGLRVDGRELHAVRRRPHDARMQRARRHDVAGILRTPRDLVDRIASRRRRADDLEVRDGFERGLAFDAAFDPLARGELTIRDVLAAVGLRRDHAVLHLEIGRVRAEFLGRHLHEYRACFGRRGTQHRPQRAHAQRPERPHVERAQVGVAEHDIDRRERNVQFLRGELRKRSHDTLPHLDLSHEHGHAPVGPDVNEGVEIGARPLDSRGIPDRAEHSLRGREGEYDEQSRAGELQEVAAVDRVDESPALGDDHFLIDLLHLAPPVDGACDAAAIASMIPACAPHRQRCPSIPFTISSRVGFGLFASSAVPPMIMPGVQ